MNVLTESPSERIPIKGFYNFILLSSSEFNLMLYLADLNRIQIYLLNPTWLQLTILF